MHVSSWIWLHMKSSKFSLLCFRKCKFLYFVENDAKYVLMCEIGSVWETNIVAKNGVLERIKCLCIFFTLFLVEINVYLNLSFNECRC